jgi:predicted metalloendopeptidase
VQQQEPRWQTCVKVVDGDFGDALGESYVQQYFPPEAKRRIGVLVENAMSYKLPIGSTPRLGRMHSANLRPSP